MTRLLALLIVSTLLGTANPAGADDRQQAGRLTVSVLGCSVSSGSPLKVWIDGIVVGFSKLTKHEHGLVSVVLDLKEGMHSVATQVPHCAGSALTAIIAGHARHVLLAVNPGTYVPPTVGQDVITFPIYGVMGTLPVPAGVSVRICKQPNDNSCHTFADVEDGAYYLIGLSPGQYRVELTGANWTPQRRFSGAKGPRGRSKRHHDRRSSVGLDHQRALAVGFRTRNNRDRDFTIRRSWQPSGLPDTCWQS